MFKNDSEVQRIKYLYNMNEEMIYGLEVARQIDI